MNHITNDVSEYHCNIKDEYTSTFYKQKTFHSLVCECYATPLPKSCSICESLRQIILHGYGRQMLNPRVKFQDYNDVIMGAIASQITSLTTWGEVCYDSSTMVCLMFVSSGFALCYLFTQDGSVVWYINVWKVHPGQQISHI